MTVSSTERDEGIALFYALLVTLVVGGVVAVVFATALGEQRQAAFEVDFEDTIHVAEAGAEIYMGRLVGDNSQTSGIDGPEALGSTDASQWAIDAALKPDGTGYDLDAVTLPEGEVVALRPDGEDAEFIYGVGFTPSREAYEAHLATGAGEAYARVVRVQIAFAPNTFEPDHAMLTGGNLKLSGSYKIYGSSGSVHTNGAITIDGSTGTADSGVSYSGSCNGGCDQASGPVAQQEISAISIKDFWGTPSPGNENPAAIQIAGEEDWYDYCSGTWRQRSIGDSEPCQGKVVDSSDPNIEPWTGLNYNNPAVDGSAVYYFAGDYDIDIKEPSGEVTFITGGNVSIGPSANSDPPTARYPGWYVVAEGDVTVSGNATGDTFETGDSSIVWSNGTIHIGGTVKTNGVAFVGVDGGDVGSSYSGGGAGSITYNGDAFGVLPGEKVPIVVQWDELR